MQPTATFAPIAAAGAGRPPPRCRASAARGCHMLRIDGYSGTLHVQASQPISSRPFRVGGRTWRISYAPRGRSPSNTDFISFHLSLEDGDESAAEPVVAQATFCLFDRRRQPVPSYTVTTTNDFSVNKSWGYERFIERKKLESSESELINDDDCLTFGCHVNVVEETGSSSSSSMEETGSSPMVVPPSDMHRHLGDLLSSEEDADVEFLVGGEVFAAHRCVLAARSPVFKAELLGPMKEGTTTHPIRIDDVEPRVFRALLTFMYTDTWTETVSCEDDEATMAQHLLVVADMYGLQRLKLICEDTLCNYIDKVSAATILVLAEQHGCHTLRVACFEFLRNSRDLLAAIDTEGFEHLIQSCPSVIKELFLQYC